MKQRERKEPAAGAQAATPLPSDRRGDFDKRTVGLVIDQFRRGLLQEGVLRALLVGIGLEVTDE